MLKALFLLLMNLALAAMATAQMNLVPNGGFEDTIRCDVHGLYSLLTAEHWSSPNMATPDVYDCDLQRLCGEAMDPNDEQGIGIQGYQNAHEGSRFAAGFQWYGPNVPLEQDTRDYLMVRLTQPMVAGGLYEVSLFYSRAEGYRYAIDHLGVYFGPDSVFATHPVVLELEPQVNLRDPLETYLTEGDAWVQLADTFVATGGEQWMIIGTFERSDEVNGVSTNQQTTYGVAYYYMDDIAVRQLELPNGLPELTVWYVGAGLLGLHWDVARSVDRLRLFEVSGRLLMESMPQHVMGTGTLPIPGSFADGVYLVEVWSGNTRWIKRFVKEEGVY
ncbi:MAG: hypothetical protein IPH05_15725 [Flavobacteriales bacterium]|jgi:hypothetical protein|nr:hypothetical protein [Flavobacteriales bacterium]MBK7100750.1 hypothetical protein [Flavobacteriales bacterium]MBK8532914.1 hypothetical protein [Flavobacteriales bacterium]